MWRNKSHLFWNTLYGNIWRQHEYFLSISKKLDAWYVYIHTIKSKFGKFSQVDYSHHLTIAACFRAEQWIVSDLESRYTEDSSNLHYNHLNFFRKHFLQNFLLHCSLQPGFNQLYSHIRQISEDPEQLSQMEKCTMMEALILIRYPDWIDWNEGK